MADFLRQGTACGNSHQLKEASINAQPAHALVGLSMASSCLIHGYLALLQYILLPIYHVVPFAASRKQQLQPQAHQILIFRMEPTGHIP